MPTEGKSVLLNLLIGGIAGVAATVPMTVVAARLFEMLPRSDRYPLPPRELTEKVLRMSSFDRPAEETLVLLTLASHFGFGAFVGAGYGLATRETGGGSVGAGIFYGLAIWAASYMGWIPGFRLLRPATEHPIKRTSLMVAAHLAWGAALGGVAIALSRALTPFRGGTKLDA